MYITVAIYLLVEAIILLCIYIFGAKHSRVDKSETEKSKHLKSEMDSEK